MNEVIDCKYRCLGTSTGLNARQVFLDLKLARKSRITQTKPLNGTPRKLTPPKH